jgi:hypothetical protein
LIALLNPQSSPNITLSRRTAQGKTYYSIIEVPRQHFFYSYSFSVVGRWLLCQSSSFLETEGILSWKQDSEFGERWCHGRGAVMEYKHYQDPGWGGHRGERNPSPYLPCDSSY